MDLLYLPLRPIRSAPGPKAEAKPRGLSPRERSQGRAARPGREVACLPGEAGPPMGQSYERASPFLAKFDQSASFATGRDAAHAVSGAPIALVLPAVTSCTWYVRFTDEVPRRPVPPGSVTPGYKPYAKGRSHASETGTASPRPRLKGCQQRQSRGAPGRFSARACSERQNLRVPPGPQGFMGPVSPVINATKWRDGTSSCQQAGPLSNSPQQPPRVEAAVRSR
jgi:hypothetical protein